MLIGCLLCSLQSVQAQTALLPPSRSDADYLLRLTIPIGETRSQSRYERRYLWSNNVLAISEGNRKTIEPREVTTNTPFYMTDKLTRFEFRYRQWNLEYADGTVSQIRGNADAAQLWLDSKAKNIDQQRFYRPFAVERKGHWRWLGVRYTSPFRATQAGGEVTVGIRYLLCRRFRDGWLSATHFNNRLLGEMRFFSSRGIGLQAPSGKGFAVDLTATFGWAQKWRGLIAIEGLLGEVHWKRLREVVAFIDTGAFAQDPEGFIRDLPFLVGRERHLSLRRSVDRQWVLGLSQQHRHWSWAVMFADRIGKPNWHLGIVRRLSANQRLLFDIQVPVRVASFGYATKNLTLFLSLSHPDPTDALTLSFQGWLTLR